MAVSPGNNADTLHKSHSISVNEDMHVLLYCAISVEKSEGTDILCTPIAIALSILLNSEIASIEIGTSKLMVIQFPEIMKSCCFVHYFLKCRTTRAP